MGSIVSFLRRIWLIQYPPKRPKVASAIRVGLLAASWIAPMAIIIPAKSHPEVIIAAVAARDQKRAKAFAKRHGIPIVHESYETLVSDSSIDAVYVPLPNGLHYEWALRALRAGKHVLLEKPSTSNAVEAKKLFEFHASLPISARPVLLEAFHYRFHPAWTLFLSLLSPPDVASASSTLTVFKGFAREGDIRFNYDLAGGALMDEGTYTISCLRQIFAEEPTECLSAEWTPAFNDPSTKCDEAFKGSWRFPNGGVGTIYADLRRSGIWGLPWMDIPKVTVTHRPRVIPGQSKSGEVHELTKTVCFKMFPGPQFWHSIEVVDANTTKSEHDGKILKSWREVTYKTAYVWDEPARPGASYWTTYRYMLEEFVNAIKGRKGSGIWVEGSDSVKQMMVVDQGYEKAGLPMRPTSRYE